MSDTDVGRVQCVRYRATGVLGRPWRLAILKADPKIAVPCSILREFTQAQKFARSQGEVPLVTFDESVLTFHGDDRKVVYRCVDHVLDDDGCLTGFVFEWPD